MKYLLNIKFFTFSYVVIFFVLIKYKFITFETLKNYLGESFFSSDIKNIALANVGIFASLTGFLIASIPFLVSIIIKESYLIKAVKNNLNEVTNALKIILLLFILSLIILIFDVDKFYFSIKVIIMSTLIYLYIILLYYIYEIVEILHIFVSDLNTLKQKMHNESNDKILKTLQDIEKNTKSLRNRDGL